MTRRQKRYVAAVATLGISVLGGAAFANRDVAAVWWYAWRLGSTDEEVRLAAIEELRALGSDHATPHLVAHIRADCDVSLSRRAAFDALVAVDADAPAVLAALLEDGEWTTRFWAACFLGEIGPPAFPAVPALERRHYDAMPAVSDAAAIALERIGAAER